MYPECLELSFRERSNLHSEKEKFTPHQWQNEESEHIPLLGSKSKKVKRVIWDTKGSEFYAFIVIFLIYSS